MLRLFFTSGVRPEFLDLAFQSVYAVEHTLYRLRDRVWKLAVFEIDISTDLLPGAMSDAAGDAYDYGVGRDFIYDDRACADLAIIPYLERAEYLRARAYNNIAADGRMAFLFPPTGPAEGDAVVDGDVLADFGGFADNDPHAVVDKEAGTDLCAGVYLDTGKEAAQLRGKASGQLQAVRPHPVRRPVKVEYLNAGIASQNLQRTPARRITILDCLYISSQCIKHTYTSASSKRSIDFEINAWFSGRLFQRLAPDG